MTIGDPEDNVAVLTAGLSREAQDVAGLLVEGWRRNEIRERLGLSEREYSRVWRSLHEALRPGADC